MSRQYVIDGKTYHSVTTILSIINKPGLMFWYGKLGTKAATKIRDKSAKLGNRIHKLIKYDSIRKGDELVNKWRRKGIFKGDLWRITDQYLRFKVLNRLIPIKTEYIIKSKKYGYAGTLDWLGTKVIGKRKAHKIIPILIDWKTGGKIYPEYALQLVAYYYGLLEEGIKVRKLYCVAFSKDLGRPEVLCLRRKKLRKLFRVFLAARTLYLWSIKTE